MESDEVTKVVRMNAAAQNIANRSTFGFQGGMNSNMSQRLNSMSILADGNSRQQ